jgi:hypothetical protein
MLAFRIFEDAGFHKKLRAVPEDIEGIDIEFLRSQIRKSEEKAISEKNDEPVSFLTCRNSGCARRNGLDGVFVVICSQFADKMQDTLVCSLLRSFSAFPCNSEALGAANCIALLCHLNPAPHHMIADNIFTVSTDNIPSNSSRRGRRARFTNTSSMQYPDFQTQAPKP